MLHLKKNLILIFALTTVTLPTLANTGDLAADVVRAVGRFAVRSDELIAARATAKQLFGNEDMVADSVLDFIVLLNRNEHSVAFYLRSLSELLKTRPLNLGSARVEILLGKLLRKNNLHTSPELLGELRRYLYKLDTISSRHIYPDNVTGNFDRSTRLRDKAKNLGTLSVIAPELDRMSIRVRGSLIVSDETVNRDFLEANLYYLRYANPMEITVDFRQVVAIFVRPENPISNREIAEILVRQRSADFVPLLDSIEMEKLLASRPSLSQELAEQIQHRFGSL